MNLIQSIREILRNGTGWKSEIKGKLNASEDSPAASQDPQRFQQILDGMGTGTARIVIDKEATRRISEKYEVRGLANRGRYYVARVVRPDGSVIDELLVDKQIGSVQFLSRRS